MGRSPLPGHGHLASDARRAPPTESQLNEKPGGYTPGTIERTTNVTTPILSPLPTPGNALLDAALAYAARGWSIIAVNGKRAAGLWKPFQDRPADEPTLRRMFSRPGITGLAVITGRMSGGLAIRDFDQADAYHRWTDAHADLASSLPTVQTVRGFHVYFTGPERFHDLGDGEYRGDGGHYCLLPPSAHPDGPAYRWLIPLPSGELPTIDPVDAGLLTDAHPEHTPATHAHTADSLHVSDEGIEAAILATLPTAPGQRNHRIWALARRLKGSMPGATTDALEVIVRTWHTRALSMITTKDFLESWIDFRTAWANVKRPAGATMAEIAAAAKARMPADADAIAKLVALCRAMQEHHGPGRVWPLSCRVAASVIGTGHDTAARVLKMLVLERTIELVKPAGTKGTRRAAEYRFLGTLKGEQP